MTAAATVPAAWRAALAPALAAAPPGGVGVAVSGGGDSLALLLLLDDWAREARRPLAAATVDHGLRPGSAAEAEAVARFCAGRSIPHSILRWRGWSGRGNLQAAARDARRDLLGDWAKGRGLGAVALGHTLDDQAETLLMRLARGSGVDGLAAMAPVAEAGGIVWLRPLLGLRRAALRGWLAGQAVDWIEDPSNADPAFDRVRARAALVHLAPLGVTPERLAATAGRMATARTALAAATAALAARAARLGPAGDVSLDPGAIAEAPRDVGLRLVADALAWVSGAAYRPRFARLEAAFDKLAAGRVGHGITLHGCVLRRRGDRVAVRREPARAAPPVPLAAGRWDNRWELAAGPAADPAADPGADSAAADDDGLAIGATGAAGLARCPDWRAGGEARETLLTTPALWRGETLVAAPLVAGGTPWRFRRIAANPPPWVGGQLR